VAVIPRLVKACRLEPVDRTPVWFMRQAGRYLPEYREVRSRHSLLDICADAELTAEVTLQPMRRFDLDAAIVFADIMLPLISMGVDVEFVPGVGPVIGEPVRTRAAVDALGTFDPEPALSPTLDAIRAVRAELAPELAVVGFAGAPFTLASYLVEGGPSKSFANVRALMASDPTTFSALLEKLAGASAAWLQAQVGAGADVAQLFDSWAGWLDARTYRAQVAEHSARVLSELTNSGQPTIHFAVGAAHLLEALGEAGGSVIGVDWRLPLDEAWRRVGDERGIQGNLDPGALLGPPHHLQAAVQDVMERAAQRPGHIFNVGHGVLPTTPPDAVEQAVGAVRRFESSERG
jgi:uroporphyrinogen decarboxylase